MQSDTSKTSLSRRDVLLGAVAITTAGAALSSAPAFATDGAHHQHHDKNPNSAVIDTSQACIKAGSACLDHCFELLISGEEGREMAECANSVNEMLTMTNTLMQLASQKSSHLKAFAGLCKSACEDCAKACNKHADKHAACKTCMDACKDCAEACDKVV
jgi:Cys-rich four helix bundle protein (predicted Tat secretion target)